METKRIALVAVLLLLLSASAAAAPKNGGGVSLGVDLVGLIIAIVLIVVGFYLFSYREVIIKLIGLILLLVGIFKLIGSLL